MSLMIAIKKEKENQRMKKNIIFAGLTIVILSGCVYKNVNTFEKYCDHIHQRNETQAYGWEEEAIKEDFVNFYNQILLSSIADIQFGEASPQDSIIRLLYEKELIGVTQNGDELHIRNKFLISDSDSILLEMEIPVEETFTGFIKKFEYLLKNRFELQGEMPEVQRCLFAAVGAFYKKIVIHGNSEDGKVEIINEGF